MTCRMIRLCLALDMLARLFFVAHSIPLPPSASQCLREGDVLLVSGHYEQAMDKYSDALNSADATDEDRATAYYKRGTANHLAHNYLAAVRDLNVALNIQPEFHIARTLRAKLHSETGKYDQAIDDLKTVIRAEDAAEGSHHKAEEDLAKVKSSLMLWEKAGSDVDALSRVIEDSPGHVEARLRRARLLIERGESQVAMEDTMCASCFARLIR